MNSNSAILSLDGVSKVFDHDIRKKKETAVADVSFDIERAKCTGLLGHNGAGKTTSIKMILGLIKPTSGKITYSGEPFQRKCLKEIGYMPEINKLSSLFTPYETLDYQMRLFQYKPKGDRKKFILEKLESVGLAEHARKRNGKLSKGQGRRLGFAYATIHDPKLLILDEPFSGLDPIGRDFMSRSIENLKALGTSILLCTHEVEAVKRLCENVLILNHGKKVFDSTSSVANDSANKSDSEKGQRYQLVLSGLAEGDLENLKREQSLPDYESVQSRGFLHRIDFADYEKAMVWLNHAVKEGIVVLEFKELGLTFGDNEDLLKYLRDGVRT